MIKVNISEQTGYFRLAFEGETANDQLLLNLLLEKRSTPFTLQEDGVVALVHNREIPYVRAVEVKTDTDKPKRHFSRAGKKAIARAQKARWTKFKKLGKTPLNKTKKPKKYSGKNRSKITSKAARGYWAKMTPEERKAEIRRRMNVANAKKNKTQETPLQVSEPVPTSV